MSEIMETVERKERETLYWKFTPFLRTIDQDHLYTKACLYMEKIYQDDGKWYQMRKSLFCATIKIPAELRVEGLKKDLTRHLEIIKEELCQNIKNAALRNDKWAAFDE